MNWGHSLVITSLPLLKRPKYYLRPINLGSFHLPEPATPDYARFSSSLSQITAHLTDVDNMAPSEVKVHENVLTREATCSTSASDLGEKGDLSHVETFQTTYEQAVEGRLYNNGELILQPAKTRDPRDPMNLSLFRRILAIFCLTFFGALAASAELILGAMLPVFSLYYSGLNPKILIQISEKGGLPVGADPLATLAHLTPESPPIFEIYLLASLPVLMIGLSNLVLIPTAISIGRRPVVLITGVIAIIGAIWAGFSQSLHSHIAARCVQAIGAGTVESLIPFIIQDMVYVHQRNTWISAAFAAQGIIIIALGFSAPYLIIQLSWRWAYYVTALGAGVFLVGVFLWLPESRYQRTRAEMNGVPREDEGVVYEEHTIKSRLQLFTGKIDWQKGWNSFIDTLRTFFYPQIFFITMLNSAMIATAFAAGYTVAPALLTKPWAWPFEHLGFCLVPILISAVCVAFITGGFADWVANLAARKRGQRVPENQLLNLILPTLCALLGAIIFGVAGANQTKYPWEMFLLGLGLMTFGFLGANTIGAVYVLECYPHLAGPALVNIASFRCLIAFVLSFKVSDWIVELGYFKSFMIYTGLMAGFAVLIPVVWYFGPAWRRRWPATHFGDR